MYKKPIIECSGLRLLPVEQYHLTERYIGWLNNKDVVRYSELRHFTHTYESCFLYWQSFQGKPHLYWAIETIKDGEWFHIGNINAYVDENNKVADMGILIGEQTVWGKGYGVKAWQSMCEFLFKNRNMRKITAGTLSVNKGMLKIMIKTGMVEDGKRIKQYICEGQEVDICHYALFRENWIAFENI